MPARTLYFTGPREVAVRERPVPEPAAAEVCVRAELSAISPGTELLVYRGEVPADLEADETIDALDGALEYPLQYGYATVGRVTAVGDGVDDGWRGRRVFAFRPHESHFLATPDELVPAECPPERAAFLANAEAAVGFLMDGRPRIGEQVVVFGQGVVGLLTTALLARFPLGAVVTVERHARRRELSRELGADDSLAPDADVRERLAREDVPEGADLAFELSGSPAALDDAIAATGYAGRVVVGSWYGTKRADLDLGGAFHRSHVRLRASQVSRIDPDHAGRWDKDRRLSFARDLLGSVDVPRLVTHRMPVERAGDAYRLLDERPDETVGVLLTY